MQVLLDISDRTLARRRERQVLSKAESDRLYRVARVAARAEEVLGSSQAAERWLKEPIPALGLETPLSMPDTDEGAQMVGDVLGRIEHGVFNPRHADFARLAIGAPQTFPFDPRFWR